MAKVHVIACQKGGVGKTTIAMNLAAVTSSVLGGTPGGETPVMVIGADPQRSADWWASRIGETKLPFAWTQAYDVRELARLATIEDYDHIFVDTPGSLENEHLLKAALEHASDVTVPIVPEALSFLPVDTTITKLIVPSRLPYRVVVNDWDPRDGRSDLEQTQEFVKAKKWPLARTVIRHYKVHSRGAAEGLVCTEYAKNRVAMEAREDMFRLALELGFGGK